MLDVSYIGRHHLDWYPAGGHPAPASSPPRDQQKAQYASTSTPSQPSPDTESHLRADFIAYVQDRLRSFNSNPNSNTKLAERKKDLVSALVVALDPEALIFLFSSEYLKLLGISTDTYFYDVLSVVLGRISAVTQIWEPDAKSSKKRKKRADETGSEDEKDDKDDSGGKGLSRPAGDRRAQNTVPGWYDKRCVLSGLPYPEAAHIVPVRITRDRDNLIEPWNALSGLWPLPRLEELRTAGLETANILPLNPGTHRLWDEYQFALRPIANPDDDYDHQSTGANPPKSIYIQMVWLDDEHPNAVATAAPAQRDHLRLGGLVDFRRPDSQGHFVGVEHGDVYKITTTDPTRWPLPSFRLLQLQYGAHKLLGGMRAAGALREIFGGEPPDPDDFGVLGDFSNLGTGALSDVAVPDEWRWLAERAVDAGVLGPNDAHNWHATTLSEDDVPDKWRRLIDAAVDKGVLGPDAAIKWKIAAVAEEVGTLRRYMDNYIPPLRVRSDKD